jgi:hypothetical protein
MSGLESVPWLVVLIYVRWLSAANRGKPKVVSLSNFFLWTGKFHIKVGITNA